jgi:hypothetical protein
MPTREQYQAVELAVADARANEAGYVRVNCPFCLDTCGKEDRTRCLSVSVTTGRFKCFRCATRGRIDLEPDVRPVVRPNEGPKVFGPPDGFMELTREPARSALSCEDARTYLRSRGLADEEVWEAAHLGCCIDGRYSGRIVIPVLSPTDDWWGWVSRAWVKKADRPYLNASGMELGSKGMLYNHVALEEDTDQPVLVMEGAFDALAYWPRAVAVLGKPTRAQVLSLRDTARPVVIVLDGDAWEEAEMLALTLRLEGKHAGWVRLPPCVDPDEVDPEWLYERAYESLDDHATDRVENILGG